MATFGLKVKCAKNLLAAFSFFVQYLQADIIDASNLAMCEVHSDPSDCTLSPFVIGECQMTLLNSSD